MRRNLILIIIFVLLISVTFAQYPDTIIVQTKQNKGFGPFAPKFGMLKQLSKDNFWRKLIPNYKGLPTELKNMMLATIETDFKQYIYQSYISGKMTKEDYSELITGWNWTIKDFELLSKEYLGVLIGVVAGYDSSGLLKIKIDKNRNYDFSDDNYFSLPAKVAGQGINYNDSSLLEVTHEYFDCEKKIGAAWLYLDYFLARNKTTGNNNTLPRFIYAFAQHYVGEFKAGGNTYNIALLDHSRTVLREDFDVKIWNNKLDSLPLQTAKETKKNGHVKIDTFFYRIGDAKIDGSSIMLIKDLEVAKKGGSEVGMKALNFEEETITGERIYLESLKGNIVLIDFWGTFCYGCVQDIPNLKEVYRRYKSKNFKMIGIALNDSTTLTEFIQKNKIEWPQIAQENEKEIIAQYNVSGYPTTFLIDENGKIIAKHLRGKEILEKLEEMLGGE